MAKRVMIAFRDCGVEVRYEGTRVTRVWDVCVVGCAPLFVRTGAQAQSPLEYNGLCAQERCAPYTRLHAFVDTILLVKRFVMDSR